MRLTLIAVLFLLGLPTLRAGRITTTLEFESDPAGSAPLGATLSSKGCAYITDQTALLGRQSLEVVGGATPVQVAWNDYFPDLFGAWYNQADNIGLSVRIAAAAGQKDKNLQLYLGCGGGLTAIVLQFGPDGNLAAVTADGRKILIPYEVGAWYRFEITLKAMEPKFDLTVRNAKGGELIRAKDMKWYQPELVNGVLSNFAFSADAGGKLFVDDFVVQEIDPSEKRPWPRKLVNYSSSP